MKILPHRILVAALLLPLIVPWYRRYLYPLYWMTVIENRSTKRRYLYPLYWMTVIKNRSTKRRYLGRSLQILLRCNWKLKILIWRTNIRLGGIREEPRALELQQNGLSQEIQKHSVMNFCEI
ncbi:hypothetical protein XENTR_v10017600 [Xenopus tropicalis]|nr:hypothetical protein XENTR_v10017600 [Xenopus tropicalis]